MLWQPTLNGIDSFGCECESTCQKLKKSEDIQIEMNCFIRQYDRLYCHYTSSVQFFNAGRTSLQSYIQN